MRLRHIGWENCGHGLTSRLRESASAAFLTELLQLFDTLPLLFPRSATALLAGALAPRHCAARFASRVPTWPLPVSGHAAGLVTAEGRAANFDEVEASSKEVIWSVVLRVFLELNLGHVSGRDCVVWATLWKLLLATRGGALISKMEVSGVG